ncbi:uncharacterized protein C12orf56 isoform X1 [Hydra vulgaris]|uniref:uncharacterized protein C12orf56 isoform X1 n=1 Tax=Hydra vulgaris TaxID=6087 RepID=UPI001F5FAEB3|nr:uncharacterized protein C12orf56 [Hydra vulgaris]
MSTTTLNSTGKKFQLTDSFLRRLLAKEDYESIKTIEPAIVVTDKPGQKLMRKPSYKHTAISSNYFYALNSPANQDSDLILKLCLKNIRDIKLVYEKTDFLHGDLQEHAVHMKLLCCGNENNLFSELNNQSFNHKRGFTTPNNATSSLSNNLFDNVAGIKKVRPLPKPVTGTEMLNASYTNVFQISPSKESSSLSKEQLSQNSFVLQRSLSSSLNHSWNDIFKLEKLEEKSLAEKKSNESIKLSSSLTQSSGFFNSLNINNDDKSKKSFNSLDLPAKNSSETEEVYHVEILTVVKSSNLFNILRETWIQSLLKATKEINKFEEKNTSSTKLHANNSSEQILHKFSQLKDEVLQSTQDDELFISTKEMFFACENFFYAKIAFWKMQNLLQFYLDKMKALLHSNSPNADNRMDELDLLILIGDLMAAAFQGSETLTSRNTFLNESPLFIKNLVSCCLLVPTISPNINSDNHELDALLATWSNTQVSLLYELINAAYQFNWCFSEVIFFNTTFLAELLNRQQEKMRILTSYLINQLKLLLSTKQPWSASSALNFYCCVYLLNFICENLGEVKEHVKHFHREEIKYYICKPSNVDALPRNFPVIWILLPLFKKVVSLL